MPWEAPPQTYLSGNTAGTTHVFGPVVTLVGGANVTLSGSGNQIVIKGGAGGAGGTGPSISAGTQSTDGGTVKFADSNGITFGMSGSSQITATVKTAYVGLNTAKTNATWTVNSSGISIDAGGYAGTGTAATNASVTLDTSGISVNVGPYITTARRSTDAVGLNTAQTAVVWTVNSSGISFDAGAYLTTARRSTDAVGLNTAQTGVVWTVNSSGISFDAGAYLTTARRSTDAIGLNTAATAVTWTVNSSGLSLDAGGYLTTARRSTDAIGLNTAQTAVTWTVNSSGLSLDAGAYLTTARRSTDAIGLNTAQTNVTWTVNSSGLSLNAGGYAGTVSGATNCSVTANTAGVSVNVPAETAGTKTLSCWEPYWLVSSTGYSSHAPASWEFIPWVQPTPIGISNLVVLVSMNASVPAATSAASTGTERFSYNYGATIFTRQNYGAQSTNLSAITTASFGLTAGLSYSSTSQSFVMSWVTNSTGGTTSFTTSSNAGNWSSYVTGPKFISIPLVTTLQEGEYWIAFQHSSTSGTTNSNVTLLSFSKLQQQWPVVTVGSLGGSATLASSGPAGMGIGIASAVTTNNTMAGSVVSASTQPLIYFVMSNV